MSFDDVQLLPRLGVIDMSERYRYTRFTYDDVDVTESDLEGFSPTLVREVELTQPIGGLASEGPSGPKHYAGAMVLVRLHTRPLGVARLPITDGHIDGDVVARAIWVQLSDAILRHLVEDRLPLIDQVPSKGLALVSSPRCCADRERILAHPPSVAVIIPTHERAEALATCLNSLLTGSLQPDAIIVVDNVPDIRVH